MSELTNLDPEKRTNNQNMEQEQCEYGSLSNNQCSVANKSFTASGVQRTPVRDTQATWIQHTEGDVSVRILSRSFHRISVKDV